jgi:hypothetical protein
MQLSSWCLGHSKLALDLEANPRHNLTTSRWFASRLRSPYRYRNRRMAGRIDKQVRRYWCYKLDGGNIAVFETRGRVPVVFRIESLSIAGEAWNGNGFLVLRLSCRGGSITCKGLTLPR